MTFWERLEHTLMVNKLSEAEFSRKIGVTQATITGWKLRGSIPRADIAQSAAELLNTTVEFLLTGKKSIQCDSENGFLVPVLNQELSAGNGDILQDSDTANALIKLPKFFKQFGENLAALYVHGDSMEPTIKNGSLVIISPDCFDKSEGIYAIRMNGNSYIKRIQMGAGKIFIISDNPKYKTIEESIESQNIEVVGKLVGIITYDARGL